VHQFHAASSWPAVFQVVCRAIRKAIHRYEYAHPAAVDLLLIGSGLHFFSSDSLAMICTMP
jgi:hypothetical protein